MVLDNTGSMRGSKIAALKDAANALVDILFASPSAKDDVKIGLVPFTAAVNVGSANRDAFWLDLGGLSRLQRENLDLLSGQSLFTLLGRIVNLGWGGCVRARPEPYDLLDTPPNPAAPDTLFVPYFAPDEPDANAGGGAYLNSYTGDLVLGAVQARQRSILKYVLNLTVSGSGPNYNCATRAILPMTNNEDSIKSAIAGMNADGNTVIPAGLVWGWHLVSPGEPFTQATPYGTPNMAKILILLTDGENSINGGGNGHDKGAFSAYGYPAEGGHLGADFTNGGPERALDAKTRTLCANIKTDQDGDPSNVDITLYTIGFGIGKGSRIDNLLAECATDSAKHFLSPTTAELRSVFEKIAVGLNQLRLSK
jgi:hypothetical protein